MIAGDIGSQVQDIVGAEHVAAAVPAARRATSQPAWIARPNSAAEISELVQLASKHDAAVIPLGSELLDVTDEPDTDRSRIFIDLSRMRHVLSLDETSLIVHAQAGLTATELEQILTKRGLSLGDYPAASLSSSIGGLLAVRTPGKASRRHGFIEDAVLGISAVLADGKTIHTRVAPRRATGPDVARALCGSEGTLGIITSAVLRIHRQPEARFLAAYSLPSFNDALSAVHLALRDEAAPAAMRVYDRAEACAHLGDTVGDAAAVLLIATAGPTDLAACDRDLVASAVEALGGDVLDSRAADRWWQRRIGADTDLPAKPHLQASATPSRQQAVYQAAHDAAEASGFIARAHAARFDVDGGVLFFTFVDANAELLTEDRLERARRRVERAAADAGAYLLGDLRGGLDDYFDQLKRALDPGRIMNPGAMQRSARVHAQPEPGTE